ncbi:MBL fold metallo-hydrolase [Paenisporosarcina sp.]|uniref:MBL fold metallo-hydrolase n=1 Tax=Paenisporosarcina sp. TaxID=1932001 RepID=UPI003C754DA7
MQKRLLGLFIVFTLFMGSCGPETNTNVEEKPNTVVKDVKNEVQEVEKSVVVEEKLEETLEEVSTETNDDETKQHEGTIENTKENPLSGPKNEKLEGLEVHYIDVGQGDATLLKYSHEGEEYRVLIDTGNWNSSSTVNYLLSQKVSNIDIVVGTHPHADHIGQIDKIINTFDVEEVWLSGNSSNSQVFNRMLDAIDAKDVGYLEPKAGEVYDIGPMVIEVLNPTGANGDVQNDSVSLRITYGDIVFLFTGDTEEEGERKMISSGQNLKADIFQMGHHGSKTSNTTDFLNKVNPKVAIISVGENNQYGHPHDEVVNRVKDKGIDLYSTHINGTIIVKTDGKTYMVTTKQDGNVTPSPKNTASTSSETTSNINNANSLPKESVSESCVNINKASLVELQEIIHFGPARAEQLMQLRPFSSLDDLGRIKGIAAARLNDIKSQGLACVGG